MSGKSKRISRVSDLLQHEIATLLKRGVNDPRLKQVSITSVDVSPDMRNAKVYFALLDPSKLAEVKKALEKASGFLRHAVAENAELRHMPALHFCYDDTLVRAQNIHDLLNRASDSQKLDSDEENSKDDADE